MEFIKVPFNAPILLSDRSLIKFFGADAEIFLQNMMTQDMRALQKTPLLYSCFLTPQGQVLADFFVRCHSDGFLIDIDGAVVDDFMKRISIFKLRQKVEMQKISPQELCVTAAASGGEPDPRLPSLGCRIYAPSLPSADLEIYHDYCIDQGVISKSSGIRLGKDVMADLNFDLLGAAAWDKGCFIGQEVAARMYHRNLAKKRIFRIGSKTSMKSGEIVKNSNGDEVGEVRQVSSSGLHALAMLRVAHRADILETESGVSLRVFSGIY
jgi:folate-binding protein YgfZ